MRALIGREQEVSEILKLLGHTDVRLLTLTGAPGAGKTRLAVEVAAELGPSFEHGVSFVDLSAIDDPTLVIPAIAAAVGVRDAGRRPLLDRLQSFMRTRCAMVVLDNFEQVLPAAVGVGGLLGDCPGLKILGTSRESLRLSRWEQEYEVPPLATADPRKPLSPDQAHRVPAVALFLERAHARSPGFTLSSHNVTPIVEICSRLDGLPLAIELAAAQVKALPPVTILSRLDRQLSLVGPIGASRDRPPRQRTLVEAIDWSYSLLSAPEQQLFRRLSVFAGGFSLECVEAVCAGGAESREETALLLTQLVDKSLVVVQPSDAVGRYRLLDTIRRYAADKLGQVGERERLLARHAKHFAQLAEDRGAQLQGLEQGMWLDRLQGDHDNFRAVINWSLGDGDLDLGLRVGAALWRYWLMRGFLGEGRGQLESLLARTGGSRSGTRCFQEALHAAGVLAFRQGDYEPARQRLTEYRGAAQKCGDRASAAVGAMSLGRMAIDQGDFREARTLLEECLRTERELGREIQIAWSINYLGLLGHFEGDNLGARALLAESLASLRQLGDHAGVAVALYYGGRVAFARNEYEEAHVKWSESIRICAVQSYLWPVPYLLEGFAAIAMVGGDAQVALRLAGAADAVHEAVGAPLPPVWRTDIRRRVDHAPRAIADAGAIDAWAGGRALSLDQAVREALAVPVPFVSAQAGATDSSPWAAVSSLTRREREVAALLGRGLTNREIGVELSIAEGTARIHVERILDKLELHSRAQFVAWAADRGLLSRRA